MATPDPREPREGKDPKDAKAAGPKREAILAAGLDLFAERGFHGVSVPEVATSAGVGAGTIYRYFENKEALVNALYQQQKALVGEVMMREFPLDKTAREQFHVFWTRAIAFAKKHPKTVRFIELHHHASYLDGESRKLQARMEALAAGIFDKTARSGITKPVSASVIMAIVWGAFIGLVKSSWEGRLKITDEVVADSEQCLWEAIRV